MENALGPILKGGMLLRFYKGDNINAVVAAVVNNAVAIFFKTS